MKPTILALLFCLIYGCTFACLNEYDKDSPKGTIPSLGTEIVFNYKKNGIVGYETINEAELRKRAARQLSIYQENEDIDYYSDYAASLIYLGEYQKAKAIYEEIEQRKPDRYATASNLGTIYELIGKPDSALVWIQKSIEIYPLSHYGSEWIHVKILEYKLDPNRDIQQSILELDFGQEAMPANVQGVDLEELKNHIWHQLRERTKFVRPTNEIVGNIYFDLGNVLALHWDAEAGLAAYEMAAEYGFKSDLLDTRLAHFQDLVDNSSGGIGDWVKANWKLELLAFVCLLVVVVSLRSSLRKRR